MVPGVAVSPAGPHSSAAGEHCPSCAEALTNGDPYCRQCGESVVRCQVCGGYLSSLWCFCPRDRWPVSRVPTDDSSAVVRYNDIPRIVRFDQEVWTAPQSYGGYLWVATTQCNVYRVSPVSVRATLVEHLKVEHGRHPFMIGGGAEASPSARRPVMVLGGTRRFAVFDTSHRAPGQSSAWSASLPNTDPLGSSGLSSRPEHFVSFEDELFPAITSIGGSYAVLKLRSKRTFLSIWCGVPTTEKRPFRDNELVDLPLAETDVCGPFALGGVYCAFGREYFYWIRDGQLQRELMPRRFRPTLRASEDAALDLPRGRAPFVHGSAGIYLPGTVDGRPGLEFVEMLPAGPQFTEIPLRERVAVRPASDHRLLLAGDGRLDWLNRTTSGVVLTYSDAQVVSGPTTSSGSMVVACARGVGGAQDVRIYADGREHQRLTLARGVVPLDLFVLPGHLSLSALVNDQLEIHSWPVVS